VLPAWEQRVAIRPVRIFVAALLASCTFSAGALGDESKGALQEFGLIGTWSWDCSKELSQPRASRVVFAAPFEGNATATAQENRDNVLITTGYKIIESASIDSDKIRITLHPVTITKSDGKAASQHEYDNMSLVIQKAGERIEVIGIQFEGLPEVQRTIFFEKCLN
jgi:hypothetical protein